MSRPPRLPRFSYVGPYRYFLTFSTFERRKTFTDPATVARVLTQFQRTARTADFVILADCVMPDHVHLLVEGTTSNSDLVKFVKRLKQSSGQVHSERAKQRLWQEGYYDRVLRPPMTRRRSRATSSRTQFGAALYTAPVTIPTSDRTCGPWMS